MSKLNELRSAAVKNPALLLFLGACPAMGASARLQGALALGLTVLIICLISSLIISALRRFMTETALLWAAVIISAGLSSMALLILEAFVPGVYSAISLYIAVCAVNLMIFSSAESGMGKSLKSGLIFLAAILLTAFIRELFGSAAIWGYSITALEAYRIPLLAGAPGGFLVFALVMALFNVSLFRSGKESK